MVMLFLMYTLEHSFWIIRIDINSYIFCSYYALLSLQVACDFFKSLLLLTIQFLDQKLDNKVN